MNQDLHRKLLERAIEIAGGKAPLCLRLGVERHSLEFWLAGRATPPDDVFFAATDLVLQDDVSRASQDRRKQHREMLPGDGEGPQRPARI